MEEEDVHSEEGSGDDLACGEVVSTTKKRTRNRALTGITLTFADIVDVTRVLLTDGTTTLPMHKITWKDKTDTYHYGFMKRSIPAAWLINFAIRAQEGLICHSASPFPELQMLSKDFDRFPYAEKRIKSSYRSVIVSLRPSQQALSEVDCPQIAHLVKLARSLDYPDLQEKWLRIYLGKIKDYVRWIQSLDVLVDKPWFVGLINDELLCDAMDRKLKHDGEFLVRLSVTIPGHFILVQPAGFLQRFSCVEQLFARLGPHAQNRDKQIG